MELLPKWMLFISAVSVFNSAQCYLGDLSLSRKVYEAQPNQVTGLSNRTFGTWTLMVAVVRFVAAFNLREKPMYYLALGTYFIAGFHFCSEWLVFKTARLGRGLAGPLFVASVTSVWMVLCRGYYLG